MEVRRVVYVQRSAAGRIWHDTFASEGRLAEALALSLTASTLRSREKAKGRSRVLRP